MGGRFSTKPLISECIIWNNKNIKIDCKEPSTIHICRNWVSISNHMLESYKVAKRKGLKQSNFFVWTGIHQAIPPSQKRLELNENELNSLEFQCEEKRFIH